MTIDDLKLTPKLERILRLANLERESDGARFTGTEHCLIAILLDDGSAASRILKDKGITVEDFRKGTRSIGGLSK